MEVGFVYRWATLESDMIKGILAFFRESSTVVNSDNPSARKQRIKPQTKSGLTWWQTVGTGFLLLAWLSLFAGGITMDTAKFRCAISTQGALQLAAEARPGQPEDVCAKAEYQKWMPLGGGDPQTSRWAGVYRSAVAWLAVLLFFLPLNLAMVSATAGALGAMGNKANLEADPVERKSADSPTQSHDNSSPTMSGLLRGIFVYLFFISGLLLFDDKPFSSPGPGQYIRLAGFISLISFLVNYRPHLFNTVLDWALARLLSRQEREPQARQEEARAGVVVAGTVQAPTSKTNGTGEAPTASATGEKVLGALKEELKTVGVTAETPK